MSQSSHVPKVTCKSLQMVLNFHKFQFHRPVVARLAASMYFLWASSLQIQTTATELSSCLFRRSEDNRNSAFASSTFVCSMFIQECPHVPHHITFSDTTFFFSEATRLAFHIAIVCFYTSAFVLFVQRFEPKKSSTLHIQKQKHKNSLWA